MRFLQGTDKSREDTARGRPHQGEPAGTRIWDVSPRTERETSVGSPPVLGALLQSPERTETVSEELEDRE